jgi:hypothetical protein
MQRMRCWWICVAVLNLVLLTSVLGGWAPGGRRGDPEEPRKTSRPIKSDTIRTVPVSSLGSSKLTFRPPEGSALLVILRASGPGSLTNKRYNKKAQNAAVYVDRDLVLRTVDDCIATVDVSPGRHYVFSKTSNLGKVRLNFVAGKAYFVSQVALPTPIVVINLLVPITKTEVQTKLAEEGKTLVYIEAKSDSSHVSMKEADFQNACDDYSQWAEENPEDAANERDYPGY